MALKLPLLLNILLRMNIFHQLKLEIPVPGQHYLAHDIFTMT